MKKKVLVGSPIKQKPHILKEFLISLQEMKKNEVEVSYCFIDDNDDVQSSFLLEKFAEENENVLVWDGHKLGNYNRDDDTHHWNEELIWKVADYKNKIIRYMMQNQYDYLFFVDSDLVLHPKTLQHLVSLNKDIVSEVFWTKWKKDSLELPQVWLYDHYTLYEHYRGEQLKSTEIHRRTLEFLDKLKVPGIYEVGGLGACTLFSRHSFEVGVNFSEIKNLTLWGEDRHLCIRAAVLGIKLFVDTHFPAYHIYRDAELAGVQKYKKQCKQQIELHTKDQILDVVITAMETYLNKQSISSKKEECNFCISKTLASLLEKKEQLKVIEGKGDALNVCYPQVISLEEHCRTAVVELMLINVRNIDEDQNEKLRCRMELNKEDKEWIIDRLYIKPQMESYKQISTGKNKKITLVYTSYSGSNTVALYKKMPKEIKNEYVVELIQQQSTSNYVQNLVSSDVVVLTEGNYFLNKKKFNPNQLIIDLWHGFPLKAMGFVDKKEVNKNRFMQIWDQVNYTTSYSKLYNEVMNKCIKIDPNKYIVTGQPRNDLLFQTKNRELLFKILNKKENDKKVVFYMPTYRSTPNNNRRDGKRSWQNVFDFKSFNLKEFQDFLQRTNCEFVVKLHPAEEGRIGNIIENFEGIHLLTNEMLANHKADLYELLGAVDLLITDYSSVYFDYLLLDKPMIFTPTDYSDYEENRGFLLSPYEEWTPGPKVFDQQSLKEEIVKSLGDKSYYEKERKQVRERIHEYQDANSSQRVWDLILSSI